MASSEEQSTEPSPASRRQWRTRFRKVQKSGARRASRHRTDLNDVPRLVRTSVATKSRQDVADAEELLGKARRKRSDQAS